MPTQTAEERLAQSGLRLPEGDLAPFAALVADLDRISASLAAAELGYADEPAVIFTAPRARS
jgi:hypothetical protein